MSQVHKLHEAPTLENTIMKPEQVTTHPIYVNKATAAKICSVSKSTIYSWLKDAEESGDWPNLSIRPSATITLIHLKTLKQYLISRNRNFL